MDLSFVVTNKVEHPSVAVRLTALTIDFIAHQATTLYRTPDPTRASAPGRNPQRTVVARSRANTTRHLAHRPYR